MRIRLIILFYLFSSYLAIGQGFDVGSPELHCITGEEKKLYDLITDYRNEQKLPLVKFSRSLSYVARIHAMDISHNRPDFGGCNPHSWSDKGKWKPCCYNHDNNRIACMTQKPKELTGYKYKAYEIVYYDEVEAKAEDAFNLWKEIALMNDYLLNTGKWTTPWLAVGVGIYHEYACVWFGEGIDASAPVTYCDSTMLVSDTTIKSADTTVIEKEPDHLYYIITSSVSTLDQANQAVTKMKQAGYAKAQFLKNATFYRIAIDFYKDEQSAYTNLETIKRKFPQAWLLKPKTLK